MDILKRMNEQMKRILFLSRVPYLLLLLAVLPILSCKGLTLFSGEPSATTKENRDTFFSGRAFVDKNGNNKLDSSDSPLKGARFTAGGFSSITDASGLALIVISGYWDQPLSVQMAPPEGSGNTLIGPTEVILQSGVQDSADFLFAESLTTPFNTSIPEQLSTPKATVTNLSEPDAVLVNLVYCTTTDGVELTMDAYQPRKGKRPAPVVIYIHGGGWIGGDKSDGAGHLFTRDLLNKGYFIAAINYRLAPKYKFPAQIEDAKCAVRNLRANASKYDIDPNRIGVIGGSAGGHLVSLLGLSDKNAGWDVGQYTEFSSRVQAVVDMFGPTDLSRMLTERGRRLVTQVFGVSGPDDPILKTSSPISYITSDDPPFLILQGEEDEVVPLYHSQFLYDELVASGLRAQLVMVKNAGHGFRPVGGDLDPTIIELRKMVADFFDQYLDN
jgi:acetyl esterase/lipase